MSENTRLIKKYPNRRLYDTATSSYITLADVKKLVLEQIPFRVVDAKSSEDLTRSILLQIILDEEGAGAPMFTSDMLSQIIRFYGNAMQGMIGTYLEKNIQTFMEIQRRLQEQSQGKIGDNPMLNTDAWSQFVKMQGPTIQGLMSDRFGTAPAFVVAAVCFLGVLVYAIYDLRSKDRFADIPDEEPKISMAGH